MSAPRFSNPFAPLTLTREGQEQLNELAEIFVNAAIANYEDYLIRDKRELNPSDWKFLRQREDVRVYCDRSKPRPRSSSRPKPRESVDSVSEAEEDYDAEGPSNKNESDLPVMLTVGTLVGDLYDTMYGVVNPTIDMMRIKTSYVEDVVVNAAVLATIKEPSLQDPFQSLSVKWAIKGQPIHIRSIVKNRDLVYLESTGLRQLPSTGELIGFQLLHSVSFPETHTLPYAQRGNMSICAIYRQHDKASVDIYARGFLDPTGRIMRALVIKSATDVMISVGRNIVCAQMKKLAYALRRRHNPVLLNSAFDDRLKLRVAEKKKRTDAKNCSICTRGLSSLAPLTFGKLKSGTQCRLCLQTICSSCSVKKKLSSIAPQDKYLYQMNMTFCLLCVTAVTQANAFEIACDEVAQKDASLGYGRSVTSSISSTNISDSFDDRDRTVSHDTRSLGSFEGLQLQ